MAKKPAAVKELPPELAKIPETYQEGVGILEESAPNQPPPVADQIIVSPKVVVWFNFVRTDGTAGSNRLFLSGLYNLRTQNEIEQVEKLIMERDTSNQLASVMITGWKPLEA